jgi:multicomponent K+:H+ antiporter subunit D
VPGLHYVLINLAGSSFFLIAIGILYGVTGTLNMADLGLRLRSIDAGSASLVAAAGTMLQLVFLLKAAAFPLYFCRAYAGASGRWPLFAIMTKVGIYAILRTQSLIFGLDAGPLAGFMHDVLWWMALATMAVGPSARCRPRGADADGVSGADVGWTAAGWHQRADGAGVAAVLYYLQSTAMHGCVVPARGIAGCPWRCRGSASEWQCQNRTMTTARSGAGHALEGALFSIAAVAACRLAAIVGLSRQGHAVACHGGPLAPVLGPQSCCRA